MRLGDEPRHVQCYPVIVPLSTDQSGGLSHRAGVRRHETAAVCRLGSRDDGAESLAANGVVGTIAVSAPFRASKNL